MSLTCVPFTTLHCVHVSLASLTYVPITVQRKYLPYKWQPGNAQFGCPLIVPYFSQSLGAGVPFPNTSTHWCYHSPSRHGCWCPMHPFWGVCFVSPVFRIHVLLLNYIQYISCTVKSPTSPTCLSFKLFNVVCVHVLCVQLSLQHLQHVTVLNYNEYIEDIPL